MGYKFAPLPGYDGPKCRIEEPIKFYSTPTTTLTSPSTLSCSFAEPFGDWAADFGAKNMTHFGSYNCRRIAGPIFMSQHNCGNAIDISMIESMSISSS